MRRSKSFGLLLRDLPGVGIKEVAGFDAWLHLLASSPQMTGAFFDLMMPGMAGRTARGYLVLHFRRCDPGSTRLALQVMMCVPNGYILKSSPEDEILRAVNRVMAGETYLPSVLPQDPGCQVQRTYPPEVSLTARGLADLPLTHRQRDVISQLATASPTRRSRASSASRKAR